VIGLVSFVLMTVGFVEVRIRQSVRSSEAIQAERHIAVAQTVDKLGAAVARLSEYVQYLGTTIAEFNGRIARRAGD